MAEIEAWATVDDLEQRWRSLSPSERKSAEVLLMDVSAEIDVELGGTYPEGALLQLVKAAACNAVRKAMEPDEGDAFGLADASGTWEPQNPSTGAHIDYIDKKNIRRAARRTQVFTLPCQ